MINARETCKKWIQVMMINYIVSSFARVKISFIFCWNSIPCLTRKKIFLSQNFLSFPSSHPFISLFLSVILQNTWKPTNMKQADKISINKITLYKFLFQIYIYASYHSPFSILSGYGIMFMHLSRKSDSKKSFGILRTSEYSATSINCSSVT